MRRRHGLTTAAATVAVIGCAVTASSGLWLTWNYRPGPPVVAADGSFTFSTGGGRAHDLHVWSAWVTVLVVVGYLVLVMTGLRRRWVRAVPGALVVAVAIVGGFASAGDLGWDQIALWAVAVDDPLRGVWPFAFDEQVRFILVPGRS